MKAIEKGIIDNQEVTTVMTGGEDSESSGGIPGKALEINSGGLECRRIGKAPLKDPF